MGDRLYCVCDGRKKAPDTAHELVVKETGIVLVTYAERGEGQEPYQLFNADMLWCPACKNVMFRAASKPFCEWHREEEMEAALEKARAEKKLIGDRG